MKTNDCIFCKIINRDIPSEPVYEDTDFIVIKDIEPKAKVHLLVVSKKHIPSVAESTDEDRDIICKILLVAKQIAQDFDLNSYRLVINTGPDAGQSIPHLHLHILGDEKLGPMV